MTGHQTTPAHDSGIGKGTSVTPVKGMSLMQVSIRVFMRNRLATTGLVLVVAIVLAVVVGPWFCRHDPTILHPWIGARPPGFTHPACHSENTFQVGGRADLPAALEDTSALRITAETSTYETVRIALRRGRVKRISRLDGAVALESFSLDSESMQAYELLENGELGRQFSKTTIQSGDEPPPGMFAPGQRVMMIQIESPGAAVIYDIQLAHGTVAAITADGESRDHVRIAGARIQEISADGTLLQQRYLLGTDELGRDLLSRVLYGGRISLLIGIVATLVSLIIGVCYGAVSGYVGGHVDRQMMNIVDILYAIPFMFLVIILLVLFGRNIVILFVALGAVQWLTMARIVRGQVLTLKQMAFIEAARMSGAGHWRIILRYLIPNAAGPIVIYATLTVPLVILEESFLAFIGLNVQFQGKNLDSWGSLIQQGMIAVGMDGSRAWLLIVPAVVMALALFGLNCLGDGLRDSLDPRTRNL